jgi:hypothetical protein
MDPRLQPYYLSRWKCPVHGKYTARTKDPVDPVRNPIMCPECRSWIQFEAQIKGMTVQSVPQVSKPRLPQAKDNSMIVSAKAPSRKRGHTF